MTEGENGAGLKGAGADSGEERAPDPQRAANVCLASDAFRPAPAPKTPVVIDTNIILDLFVFSDAAARPVKKALEAGEIDWIATQPMRDELARVLAYGQIVPRLDFYQLSAHDVLAAFDRHARLLDTAARCRLTCNDADDQKFIDLAVAHKALLLSKDRHVISMRKRLLAHGVRAQSAI